MRQPACPGSRHVCPDYGPQPFRRPFSQFASSSESIHIRAPPPALSYASNGRRLAKSDGASVRLTMKITKGSDKTAAKRGQEAFSLVEVTIGMGIIGTSAVALFAGFTSCFFNMEMAR